MQSRKVERPFCLRCHRPKIGCYCDRVVSIESKVQFLFLTHVREWRHPMGSARMACRFLNSSHQIKVDSYPIDGSWLPRIHKPNSYLLYPSPEALDLTDLPLQAEPNQFVILDGTWTTAKKMLKEHAHLETLPKVRLNPSSPSLFRVRKQPANYCLSSLEAAYSILTSLEPGSLDVARNMLSTFEWMNENQLEQAKRMPLFCHWWPGRRALPISQNPHGAEAKSLPQS